MTDNQMTEFLPCPHCGSDDIAPITFKGCNGDVWDEFIACGGCGATAETAEAWNTRAERTCENVGERCDFACSECGARLYTETSDGYTMILGDEETILLKPNYCPNCGAKVVGE